MTDWKPGDKERRSMNSDIQELSFEIRSLAERFDNELGSSKNPELDGSVKRHLRKISEAIEKMESRYDLILLGDGVKNQGIAGRQRGLEELLENHIRLDMWVQGTVGLGVIGLLLKAFHVV